ncbi:MAG: glycosyltransferase family 9 protein [Magnetococcales bacterium]|nr:glycosyltransferase family 9 protein [Magnetococcales bacterium]
MDLNKVIVFQTWGIGDLIMATPMLAALRRELPRAHISVVVGTRVAGQVIADSALCDELKVMLPGTMKFAALVKWFYGLRRERYDAALVCTRISYKIGLFLRLFSGIPIIAGDSAAGRHRGYTHWIVGDDSRHRVDLNMAILRLLLPNAERGKLFFRTTPESVAEGEAFWKEVDLQDHTVLGVHPGGSSNQKNKRFPPDKFKRVIEGFLDSFPDARVVVFIGDDESDLAGHFVDGDRRVMVASGLSLNAVGHVVGKLAVLLAGDSGLGHIAAAMGTPVVTLAGPTNCTATRPWYEQCRVVRTEQKLTCMPCVDTQAYYSCPDPVCMRTLDEGRILAALSDSLLTSSRIPKDHPPLPLTRG